nr:hypothetical protein [Mycoplasmopsis bovis]
MNKKELRKLMIGKRKLLSFDYKSKANLIISNNVIDFINKYEVQADLYLFINKIWGRYKPYN